MDAEPPSFGERVADRIVGAMGTWTAIFAQALVMAVWVVLNTVHLIAHWDGYPFILLNLGLSTEAGFAAFIILLAAKRHDAKLERLLEHMAAVLDHLNR